VAAGLSLHPVALTALPAFRLSQRAASAPPSALPPQQDDSIRWTDPATHQTFFIDPRTGNSWRPDDCCSRSRGETQQKSQGKPEMERSSGGRPTMVNRSDLKRTVKEDGEQVEEGEPPEWMAQTLKVRLTCCKLVDGS
jgi:hypothetical protein